MKDQEYFQGLFDRVWAIRDEFESIKKEDLEDVDFIDLVGYCDRALKEAGLLIVDMADYQGFSLKDATEHLYGEGGLYGPSEREEDETAH